MFLCLFPFFFYFILTFVEKKLWYYCKIVCDWYEEMYDMISKHIPNSIVIQIRQNCECPATKMQPLLSSLPSRDMEEVSSRRHYEIGMSNRHYQQMITATPLWVYILRKSLFIGRSSIAIFSTPIGVYFYTPPADVTWVTSILWRVANHKKIRHGHFTVESQNDGHMRIIMWRTKKVTVVTSRWRHVDWVCY